MTTAAVVNGRLIPNMLKCTAQQSLAAKGDQQRQSRYGRGQNDWQVHQHLDDGFPAEFPARQHVGQWRAKDDGDPDADQAGQQAEFQRGKGFWRKRICQEGIANCIDNQRQDGQSEQAKQQQTGHYEQPVFVTVVGQVVEIATDC